MPRSAIDFEQAGVRHWRGDGARSGEHPPGAPVVHSTDQACGGSYQANREHRVQTVRLELRGVANEHLRKGNQNEGDQGLIWS